jgi:hypothetical protein
MKAILHGIFGQIHINQLYDLKMLFSNSCMSSVFVVGQQLPIFSAENISAVINNSLAHAFYSLQMSIPFRMVVTLAFMRMVTAGSLLKEDYYKSKRGVAPGIAGYGVVSPDTPAVPPYTPVGASPVSVPVTPASAPVPSIDSLYTSAITPVYLAAYAPPTSLYTHAAFAPALASPYVPVAPAYVPATPAAYAPEVAKTPVGFSIYG